MVIGLAQAQRASELLVALATCIGSLELLHTRRNWGEAGTWQWSILRRELPWGTPLLASTPFTLLLLTRVLAAVSLAWAPSLVAVVWLWAATLLVNLRFRGTYNGGSDHMLVVVLTGLLVARAAPGNLAFVTAGMGWIGAQGVLSYFIAGIVKLRSPAWRDGSALPVLLAIPAYGAPERARRWIAHPVVARGAAAGVLAFECAFPLVLLDARIAAGGIALAAAFHLVNAWVFGLNRFLLAWAATWPAILAVASLASR